MNDAPLIVKIAGAILIYLGGATMWFYIIVIATAPVWGPIVLLLKRADPPNPPLQKG